MKDPNPESVKKSARNNLHQTDKVHRNSDTNVVNRSELVNKQQASNRLQESRWYRDKTPLYRYQFN